MARIYRGWCGDFTVVHRGRSRADAEVERSFGSVVEAVEYLRSVRRAVPGVVVDVTDFSEIPIEYFLGGE